MQICYAPVSKIESEVRVLGLVEGWVKGRLDIVSFESTFKGR